MRLWGRSQRGSDVAGLAIEPGRASLVTVSTPTAHQPTITAAASISLDEHAGRAEALAALVDAAGADGLKTHLVLDDTNYQLLLVEAPRVDPSELKSALRWRLKDLIDFHIDDAVFDVFSIPGQQNRPQGQSMMYAVAARTRAIAALVDDIDQTDLALSVIDIPELAIRNIARLDDADVRGLVTLHFGADSGLLTLTRQGDLYMSRRLGFGSTDPDLADGTAFEQVLLEIQRSMDYYSSHFSQPSPVAITILPGFDAAESLADWLSTQLDLRVGLFDTGPLLASGLAMDAEATASLMLALGAALRQNEEIRL